MARKRTTSFNIYGTRVDSGGMLFLTAADLVVLAYNAHRARDTEGVGWEDADRTFEMFWRELTQRRVGMRKVLVESCLWATTMLNEEGKLWLPYHHKDYQAFLKRLLPSDLHLDQKLNLIIPKEQRI